MVRRSYRVRGFIEPTCLSIGYRRCAEFFIRTLETADAEMVRRVGKVLLHLHPTTLRAVNPNSAADPGAIRILEPDFEGEDLVDIRDDLRNALDRAHIRVASSRA